MKLKRDIIILIWLLMMAPGAVATAQPGRLRWKVTTAGPIVSSPVMVALVHFESTNLTKSSKSHTCTVIPASIAGVILKL